MDYQTSSVALSQKLSTGYSIYDGVFTSAPSKFTVSSFSDYGEIFGGSSSIPVLELPELMSAPVDARSSKLDYSNVFGGFADSDFAVAYEELFAEPKQKRTKKTRKQAERLSPPKEAKSENLVLSNEAAYESFDGVKKFSISYNKSNHRSKSFSAGTTGIAELHAVPAYTCLIDESTSDGEKPVSEGTVEGNRAIKATRDQPAGDADKQTSGGGFKVQKNNSNWKSSIDELSNSNIEQANHPSNMPPFLSQLSEGSKPVSKVANDASAVNGSEKKMEGNDQMKPTRDLPANDGSKQTSAGVINTQKDSNRRRSSSIDKLFYSGEIGQGNRPPKMPPPPLPSLSKGQSEFEKAMASRIGVSDYGTCADSVWSTPYFDEEVDANSAASASVAALTKAIEEAQASIQMAKEMMGGKKVGLQSRVKVIVDNGKKFEFKSGGLFDKASTPKEKKAQQVNVEGDARVCVSDEPEKVTGAIEDADKCIGVKETREETHGKKIAKFPSISKEKKTLESYENVDVTDNVSAGPEEVIEAFEHADKLCSLKDIQGKVLGKEYKPSTTDHRHEEADDSEEAEQFYEFADTGEEDVSEAAEEFYEFADTSEPESSDAAEDLIDFGDFKEHCDTKLENEEAKSTRKMFQFVHEDDQEMKKTGMELFANPDQDSKKLETDTEQKSEVEKISNAVGGMPDFEDDMNQLASAHESSDHKENEMKFEALSEHDETRKLKATSVMENVEEKQNGEERGFETQEIPEMEDVEIMLVAQEWVENKIDSDACIQEELEWEQKDTPREKDTERSLNIDSRQEIIETVDDFCDEKDFEKRLTDDCDHSEGNEKLQDTREHEKVLEGATCQKEECENRLESFKLVEAERMHIPIGESTENAKVKVAQEDQKYLDCNFAAADNLYEQGISEDLNSEQGSAGHVEYDAYVEESLKVPAAEEEGGVTEVSATVIELQENDHQSEFVDEKNGMEEKGLSNIDALTPGVKHPEMAKQMEDATEIPSFDKNGANVGINDMSFGQKQDDQVGRESNEIGKEVEEFESGDIIEDVMEAEVALNQETNKNNSKTRKRWFSANEEVSETLIKLKEKGNQSESIEEEDVMEEKVICEIEGIAPGVGLAEILKQMEDVMESHSSDTNGVSVCGNARNYGQEEDSQFAREPEVACNLGKHDEDLGEINRDMVEPEVVAVNQGEMNNTKSPHRKRWFDDGNNTKVAQPPLIFGRKGGSLQLDHDVVTSQSIEGNEENQQATQRPQESKIIYSSLGELQQENNGSVQTNLSAEESETDQSSQEDVKEQKNESQATVTEEVEQKMENQQEYQTVKELEICDSLQKEVEVEKERLRQKAARRREREIQKERRAVERAMREARERAYAEARDKAAETRQKVMVEAQGKSRKTSVLANDNSLAEKASKEANLKVERAAVERATVEARERALEKALAEKAAYEAGKQAKRPVSEKLSGASRDTRAKPSVDPDSKGSCSSSTSKGPNPSNQGDSSLAERSDGSNGQAAQRNKARLEINQRMAERAAKALAEKNNRDLLQQQEQDERNRLAEALDADVKRWSSGKERNLRALLSTLQYILGPDSGWKPVPLSDIVDAVAVKKAYRKAALFVHPDKLQQRGASIQQKYTCEKVFDLLKEAWNRFNKEER